MPRQRQRWRRHAQQTTSHLCASEWQERAVVSGDGRTSGRAGDAQQQFARLIGAQVAHAGKAFNHGVGAVITDGQARQAARMWLQQRADAAAVVLLEI